MTYDESRRITSTWVAEMLRKTAEYEARLAAEAAQLARPIPAVVAPAGRDDGGPHLPG